MFPGLADTVGHMKPLTAAKKLGIYLPATPEQFQNEDLSHGQFVELQRNPPEWLAELRRNGPHPRPEVARRLGVTITALKNNDSDKPFTTAEIKDLLADQPEWLQSARASLAEQRTIGKTEDPDDGGPAANA